MMVRACVVVCLLAGSVLVVPAAVGQELLNNPSFTLPALSDCVEQQNVGVTGWVGLTRRNGDFFAPECPRDGDGVRGSIQGWDVGGGEFRQSVSGLSSSTTYTFKGLMWLGKMSTGGELTVVAEIRSGSGGNPNSLPLVAEQVYTLRHAGTPAVWLPFCIQGSPVSPATALTVRIRVSHTGLYGFAAHFDDFSLKAAASTDLATLSAAPIAPVWGVTGQTVAATITGSGFTSGSNTVSSVKLIRPGFADIDATIQQVMAGSILCSLDLTGAAMGPWTLKVRVDNAVNPDLYVPGAFVVAVPNLTNGSFELPSAPAVDCGNIQPIPGGPTNWGFYAAGTWDSVTNPTSTLFRDSNQYPPTCPPPDGGHYASSVADPNAVWSAQPEPHIYQTIRVDNSKTYLLSGYMAGRGDHTASLELLDGDDAAVGIMGEPAAAGAVHVGGGDSSAYDWKFGFVQFQPTGDLMTVRWRVTTRSPGPHVSHADKLQLATCDAAPPEVTAINPARVVNESLMAGATIGGIGFAGGPTPQVLLVRTGMAASPVVGTNVNVVDDQTITADFDLFGVSGGSYDVVVLKGGCVGRADGVLTVVASSFVNGGFELPDPGRLVECGPPAQLIRGIPTGWSTILPTVGGVRAGFDRDLDVKQPATCPPPSPGENHYGSLSWDRGGEDVIAYQTIAAIRGAQYTFGGIFAGGGPNDVLIELRDGGLSGPALASTVVHSSIEDDSYDWLPASVTGIAASDTITAVWLLRPPANVYDYLHASHADGLTVTVLNPCNDPFADADGDQDVDMEDFALLQRCLAIGEPIPTDPEYCRCFDRNFDSALNGADIGFFTACGSGPGVIANQACDD